MKAKQRRICTAVTFTVALVLLGALVYRSQSFQVHLIAKEKVGAQALRPYQKLFRTVSQLKIYESHGNKSFLPTKDAMVSEINQSLKDLEGKESQLIVKPFRAAWNERNYNEMVQSLKFAIFQVGNTSRLVADPNVDASYLVEVVLLGLPQMQDRLQMILSHKDQFFKKEEVSNAAKVQAGLYAALIRESDLARITRSIETAQAERANLSGLNQNENEKVLELLKPLQAKTQRFVTLLNRLSMGDPVRETEWSALGIDLLEQSFATWETAALEVDQVLEQRQHSLTRARAFNFSMMGFLFVEVLFCTTVFGVMIARPVQKFFVRINKWRAISNAKMGFQEDSLLDPTVFQKPTLVVVPESKMQSEVAGPSAAPEKQSLVS